jgi:broad specificity phosphatase PhoE
MSVARLVLVRHGRPAHAGRGWYDAAGMRGWLEAYDAAGLADDDAPPPALAALARDAALVAASDLPRARDSAARLAPDAPVVQSPLLRETPPAFPPLGPVRLPLAGWALAVGVRLAYQSARGVPAPTPALRQAREAARWLTELADRHGLVVAVTHVTVRGLIADALGAAGWLAEPAARRLTGRYAQRYAHWSAWSFGPPAARVTPPRRAADPAPRPFTAAPGGAGRQATSSSTPTS